MLLLEYEIIAWIFIIDTIIVNKKNKKTVKIRLNKTEKILTVTSILIGILCTIMLFKSNPLYVSPVKNMTYVGNYYFNADTHRCIAQISTANELTHKIHPLYRFILLPVMLPLIIINQLNINGLGLEIFSGYFICLVQILCNAISTIVFYKILNHEKLNNKISIIGTAIFALSISMGWSCILPETYAITTVTVLMFIYLYLKKNPYSVIFAILAAGANIITMVPICIVILFEILKNWRKFKKFFPVALILTIIAVILIVPYLLDYINDWMCKTKSVFETFSDSINYFLIPLLYGPNFIKNGSYFVQLNNFKPVILMFWLCFLTFAIVGYITNRKKLLPNICIIYLLIAYTLHVIMGYGFTNGILYSPLYCWPFVVLITLGINYLYSKSKNKKLIIIILLLLTSSILIYNVKWMFKLGAYLSKETFNQGTYKTDYYIYLKNDNYYESFYVKNKSLYRCSDGKEIIKEIDTYMVDDECISGLLKDSNWFKIYYENGKLNLNLSNKIQIIENENFYIFGMGLRKKYILAKADNSNYKLIEYESGQEILSNLTIEEFDYQNYTVYCSNNIKIFENDKGIYIENNSKVEILDESTYINIPDFNNYEHKEQLKILFNEVLVNITQDGPKPNFIAYEGVWYRDAAIVAKVLEETNNLEQINEWLNNLNEVYDKQNGREETDNLGQVLYLISLAENKNEDLINKVLEEAGRLRTEDGYICGYTDGSKHPVYQTKWLIYGMEQLRTKYFPI